MKTVLVVDDSRLMRTMIKSALRNLNIDGTFIEASNGAEALHLLESNPIDLVLLDWNMPLLSGLDFLKKVREQDAYKTLPIVMITSEAARYNVVEAVKHGVTAYLVKPINQEAFEKTIMSLSF